MHYNKNKYAPTSILSCDTTEQTIKTSSLGDHVNGCVAHGATSGPPKYLTDAEEIEIAHFLTRAAVIESVHLTS